MKRILLALFILSVFLTSGCITGQVTGPICKNVEVPYESQEEYMKTEYYTETVPYTDTVCESKDLPYSVTGFVLEYNTCNQKKKECKSTAILGIPYDCIEYCVDRSISCSLNLNNLDTEESGTWRILFSFYEVGTGNTIKTREVSKFLYPQTSKTIVGSSRIQSEGLNGDANKELTCSYNVKSIPTKQVCRDVIRYKEVQKERQVTAYRPVTKYKTEQVCE